MFNIFNIFKNKHATFCFGRFNPPNKGHYQLFDICKQEKHWFVFTSKTHDHNKNPLSYNKKLYWLYRLYPELQGSLIEDYNIKSYLQAATFLYKKGYKKLTLVVGNVDYEQMKGPLLQYNGVSNNHGYYKFKTIDFIIADSPMERSTMARKAAIDNDLGTFSGIVGINKEEACYLMDDVRQGMNYDKNKNIRVSRS